MAQLPDPRCWPAHNADMPLLRLALASEAGDPAARQRLAHELRQCIDQGEDQVILDTLRIATTASVYAHLWQQVCAAAEPQQDNEGAIVARIFAIPVVLVVGTKGRAVVSGVIPDIAEITALLDQHGAIGATRNFGLSNAAAALHTLERITPGQAYRWAHDFMRTGAPCDIASDPIVVAPGREQVHLRFLVGAGIGAVGAPSFVETASHIGKWGVPLTQLLSKQLAQPGVELLALPRPPVQLLKAAHAGRCAQLELAFSLFVSNSARTMRSASGDPTAIISAHCDATGMFELRISMSTALDDTVLEGFRWPLHPLDEFQRIVGSITALLEECRIGDVRLIGSVVADDESSGRSPFIRAADFDRAECDALPH